VESFTRKAELFVVSAETRDEATLASMLSVRAPKDTLKRHWVRSTRLDNDVVLPRRVIADVAHSITKAGVEGNDAVGYRVRLTRSAPGIQTTTADYFVVRENGRFAVRSTGEQDELGCEALHLVEQRKDKAARQWLEWAKDGLRSGAGDDPLRTLPFLRLWADGKGSVALSAAALCATGSNHKKALERLTAERTAAGVDTVAVDQAIVAAAFEAGDGEKALEATERLGRAHPTSKVVRDSKLRALWELKRYQEYEKLVRLELDREKKPGSERTQLLRWLAGLQSDRGRMKEARKTYQMAIDEGHATSEIYNGMAWNGLFVGKLPDDILNHALQAAQLSSFKSYSQLHTLACVYAELGKVEEARQTLTQLLALESDDEQQAGPATQYVIGRLAEAYGMPEVARAAYEKVTPPARPTPTGTYLLAKARLAALDRKAPANAKQ
jgi:tetratricopeptide (TPR) repeat protein